MNGFSTNDRDQWLSNKAGYHFASMFGSVESSESVMSQVARALKVDVENITEGVRATELATLLNLTMVEELLRTIEAAELRAHHR
ncbi:MAG: hypothetical protein ACWGQW_21125 [bacterium]